MPHSSTAGVKPQGVPGGPTAAELAFNIEHGLDLPTPGSQTGIPIPTGKPLGVPGPATAAEIAFNKGLNPFMQDLVESGAVNLQTVGAGTARPNLNFPDTGGGGDWERRRGPLGLGTEGGGLFNLGTGFRGLSTRSTPFGGFQMGGLGIAPALAAGTIGSLFLGPFGGILGSAIGTGFEESAAEEAASEAAIASDTGVQADDEIGFWNALLNNLTFGLFGDSVDDQLNTFMTEIGGFPETFGPDTELGGPTADEAQFAGFFGSNVANLGSGLPDASRTPAMTDFLADELGGDDTEDSGFGAGFGGGFGME